MKKNAAPQVSGGASAGAGSTALPGDQPAVAAPIRFRRIKGKLKYKMQDDYGYWSAWAIVVVENE